MTYLYFIRQSFSNDLANSAPNFTSSSRRTSCQTIMPPNRASKDNGELDVFSAEKYFSGILDDRYENSYPAEFTCESKKKTKRNKKKSRLSMTSESSANSRSVLLTRHQHQLQQPSDSVARRRRSFFDIFCCYHNKKNAVMVEGDADVICSDQSDSKLPSSYRKSISTIDSAGEAYLQSEPSSDLFEIDTIMSMNSQQVYAQSEVSIEWSAPTASSGNLPMTS